MTCAFLVEEWPPDEGAQLTLTARYIFPLGAFDELASLVDLAGHVKSLGASALLLEERPDSELDPVITLAALGAVVSSIALGIMLSPHSGRAPSVLAKFVSGLDLVSGGRAHLVLGDVRESPGQDLKRLEEQVELITKMLTDDVTTVDGPTYNVKAAWNMPRVTHPPLDADKVVIASSLAQLEWLTRAGLPLPVSLVVVLDRTSWDHDEPVLAGILENSRSKFLGALVNIEDDVEASLAFAASIADRLLATYLRWSSLPSPRELALSARMI